MILLIAFAWGVRKAVADIVSQPGSSLVPPPAVLLASGVLACVWLTALTLVFTYASCKGLRVTGLARLVLVGEIFLRSHLARYIPGRVAQLALLIVCVRSHGVSRAGAMSTVASHTFQFLLAGTILAVPLAASALLLGNHPVGLPLAGVAALATVAAGIWIRSPKTNEVICRALERAGMYEAQSASTPASRARSLTLYIVVSLCQSLSVVPLALWMTDGTGDQRWILVAAAALAYPVARVFGQVSVITPAGLGAREGAFVLLVSPFLPAEAAAIVSVWVRIVGIATEIVLYTIALIARAMLRGT